jgi:NOL1/NOP2/fmu family ribosome biogenesis protein
MSKTRRFYPHIAPGEGQYIAVMHRVRVSGDFEKTNKKSRDKKDKKKDASKHTALQKEAIAAAKDFLEENLLEILDFELIMLGENIYLKPAINIPEYGVFAAGVCVGQMQGKRLVPHHQLFSAYGMQFKRRVELSHEDKRAQEYLKGLEIKADDREVFDGKADGWAAVIIDGCATGGGKISGGICKNHYPKGLRNKL